MELSNKTRTADVRAGQGQSDAQALRLRPQAGADQRRPAESLHEVGEFVTAYETDPKQIEYVNQLARAVRARGLPVVWTYVAYMDSGEDCGVWGTRTNTPDSLQNIKVGLAPRRVRRSAARSIASATSSSTSAWPRRSTRPTSVAVQLAQGRHRGGDRRLDLGVRARHRGGQPVAQLSHDRSGGVRRRQAREPAFRQPLRHGAEVCRRRAGRRGARELPAIRP